MPICFSFLSWSRPLLTYRLFPRPLLPASAQTPASELLQGSPSRLIAPRRLPRETSRLLSAFAHAAPSALKDPAHHPPGRPPPSLFLCVRGPCAHLVGLTFLTVLQLACAGQGSGKPYPCPPHLAWNLTFIGVLGKCGINGYINECSTHQSNESIVSERPTPPRKPDQD